MKATSSNQLCLQPDNLKSTPTLLTPRKSLSISFSLPRAFCVFSKEQKISRKRGEGKQTAYRPNSVCAFDARANITCRYCHIPCLSLRFTGKGVLFRTRLCSKQNITYSAAFDSLIKEKKKGDKTSSQMIDKPEFCLASTVCLTSFLFVIHSVVVVVVVVIVVVIAVLRNGLLTLKLASTLVEISN
ncbi:hypothetical protein EDC96DRAFT_298053 [Choanephora cucurbitarum]|nr:hypothetical protein EDC96DRAFT_298053 [Choanephora cucurbitarum]